MSRRSNASLVKRLLSLTLLTGAVAGSGWFYHQRFIDEPPEYQTCIVTRGLLLKSVTASGQLNPVNMVEVGSQISGIIREALVDFNSTVTQAQVIARIDPATYEAAAIQAEGNLASARAALELARLEEQRAQSLRRNQLNTQAEYDTALGALHQAEANVKIKEGALKSAQVDLARCTIYSPIDGLVLSRNVNVGQTVAASLSAPTLFVIANDLTKMQIDASIAEADIGLVEAGQDADFTVDAFPGQTFHGKVTQIRNAPRTDQNVVTYSTIIAVANSNLKLKPGMTANVSVIVAQREQALLLPNAALRFHPADRSGGGMHAPRVTAAARETRDATRSVPGTGAEHKKRERVVYLVVTPCAPTNSSGSAPAVVLQPVPVRAGINNNAFTEVVEGLKEGDEVVTGAAPARTRAARNQNPFASLARRL